LTLATRFRTTRFTAAEALTHLLHSLLHALLHALTHLLTTLATRFRATRYTATEALTHLLHSLLHALLHALTHLRTALTAKFRALAALALPFVTALSAAAASLLSVQRDSEEEDRSGRQNRRCFHKRLPIVRGDPTTARKGVPPQQLPP
jgi:hypothetical protein